MPAPTPTPTPWILEELARQFAAVVSTMTGVGATAEGTVGGTVGATAEGTAGATAEATADSLGATSLAGGAPPGNQPENALIWLQPFDLAEGATVLLAAPAETWRLIGAKPLEAAGLAPDEIDDDSSRSTFLEILNQTMGAVGSQIGAKVNRQVLPHAGQEVRVWPPGYTPAPFQIALDGTFPFHFQLAAAPFWETLTANPSLGGSGAAATGVNTTGVNTTGANTPGANTAGANSTGIGATGTSLGPADGAPHDRSSSLLAQHSRTFDLLLDVELPVSISFGRAMVPLREVAKLTSGSVVELNRTVSDPVEIIVNNCVIARGEVVVIEGNYGVRIQQIISPQERLRTLH